MRYLWVLLLGASCWAQTFSYSARSDVTAQGYPGSIPCPSGSGCAGGGALTGANYAFTPSDFPTTEIVRLTDSTLPTSPFGSTVNQAWFTNCGGAGQVNLMDTTDTRFYLCGEGSADYVFSWNASTLTATELYYAPNCGAGGTGTGNLFFSFTQPHVAYSVGFVPNGSNLDIAFCQYDFTSAVTAPTISNGKITVLVDLATCAAALGNISGSAPYVDDISVSGDDQTFGAVVSTGSGQGTAVYAVVWDRTKGCRVLETDTGAITGSYGGAPTGTLAISDRYYVHGGRMGKGNTYFMTSVQSCISNCGPGNNDGLVIWNIATLNAQTVPNGGFAHLAVGYNEIAVNNGTTVSSVYHQQTFISYPMANTSSYSVINNTWPPSVIPWDDHPGWATDNSTDTAPFCGSGYIGNGSSNTFTPTYAWDNEILCTAMDGSGTVWRMNHTYGTNFSQFFNVASVIGAPSQDGKYFLWSTDWDGMLGKTDLVTTACTIGTNCRGDVFLAILPILASTSNAIGGNIKFNGNISVIP